MKHLSLDIETVPLKITDEEIITYLMDKKISKESRSFNPHYSKIITICIKPFGEETKTFSGENEKEILENFWTFLKQIENFTIVTHNGYKFDIPFINIRSSINNVNRLKINMNRWTMENSNHFDVMLFFSQQETFTNTNLNILAKMNGIEVKETIKGNEIEQNYHDQNWDKITTKCQQDVILLEKLFDKFCRPSF